MREQARTGADSADSGGGVSEGDVLRMLRERGPLLSSALTNAFRAQACILPVARPAVSPACYCFLWCEPLFACTFVTLVFYIASCPLLPLQQVWRFRAQMLLQACAYLMISYSSLQVISIGVLMRVALSNLATCWHPVSTLCQYLTARGNQEEVMQARNLTHP